MSSHVDRAPDAWIDAAEFRWPDRLCLRLRWRPGLPAGTDVAVATLHFVGKGHAACQLPVARPAGDEGVLDAWVELKWPLTSECLDHVELQAAPGCRTAIDATLVERLARLMARNDKAYEALYMGKDQRWGDSATQFFLAEQVCKGFTGTPAYRCSAAVICGYKAAELGDPRLIARARQHLDDGGEWAAQLPPDPHPRRNPEHLRQSMLTARWHADMAADDPDECLRTLERARVACAGLSSYFTPSFPAARSMLLLGWMHHKGGRRREAEECWGLAVDLFRWAVRDSNENSRILYGELRDILISAIVSARALALSQGRKVDHAIDSGVVLERSLRVNRVFGRRLMEIACRWWGEEPPELPPPS